MAFSPIHQNTAGRHFSSLRVTYEAQYGIQTRHELENGQQSHLPSIREKSSAIKTDHTQENNISNSSDYQPTTPLRITSNTQYIQTVPYIVPTSSQPVIAASNTKPHSSDTSKRPIIRHCSNNTAMPSPYNIDSGDRTLVLDRQLHLVHVAEENLQHRVNVELENTRTTLQHIISEQFVTLQKTLKSSDHYYIEGYEYPGQTQDIDGHLPRTYQSDDDVLVPESEKLIEAIEPIEQAHEMLTESYQPSDIPSPQDSGVSCCEHTPIDFIEYELDHYVLRMQTAVSVISNTLLKLEYN